MYRQPITRIELVAHQILLDFDGIGSMDSQLAMLKANAKIAPMM